jgi:hypothetical protein
MSLDDDLIAELDARVGPRGRRGFIAATLRRALDDERRWDDIAAALQGTEVEGEWGDDPGDWVRRQRRGSTRRVG